MDSVGGDGMSYSIINAHYAINAECPGCGFTQGGNLSEQSVFTNDTMIRSTRMFYCACGHAFEVKVKTEVERVDVGPGGCLIVLEEKPWRDPAAVEPMGWEDNLVVLEEFS